MAFDFEFFDETREDLGRGDFDDCLTALTLLELADRDALLELDFLPFSELADDLICLAIW